MIYGYARTSRKSQNVERQIRNIMQCSPNAVILKEAFTGTTQDRPVWRKLFQRLQPDDVVIFDSVSRMSRNAEEGFAEYEALYQRGVSLTFIKEPAINTEAYRSAEKDAVPMTGTEADCILAGVNEFLSVLRKKQFKLAFKQAQKEVDDLHERTKEGMLTAKLNGKQIGRKHGSKIITKKEQSCKEIIKKHSKSFGGSLSDGETIKLCGCSRNSYYKYKRSLQKERLMDTN